MSKCKTIIQRLVEAPELIQEDFVQKHLDECPKCMELFSVIKEGAGLDTAEDGHELTQQERTEILTNIRRQEQLLPESASEQSKPFVFKPKFVAFMTGITIVVASWLFLPNIFPEKKPEITISQEDPESRKMKLYIQSDSKPGLYLAIEYFPDN
jgi:hypothetical protein